MPLFFLEAKAQANVAEPDSVIFENYVRTQDVSNRLPINELLVRTARIFLHRPYAGATLEQGEREHLVVNLRELDCTTFVESCVALALTVKSGEKSFAQYKRILQKLRYRKGVIDGYSSRLHYSSDWIYENAQNGIWSDQTLRMGGIPQAKTLNFMSTHPQAYAALKNSPKMREKIVLCEDAINNRNSYSLIPKTDISKNSSLFRDGDIVFFGTKTGGLDFSHMGIIYHNEGTLTFIHASSATGKVIIQPGSLSDYCLRSTGCNGIAIVRLNENPDK